MSRGKTISTTNLREQIKKVIGENAYISMLNYINTYPPELWGTSKSKNYRQKNLDLMIYHDLENIGFSLIQEMLQDQAIPHTTMKNINL